MLSGQWAIGICTKVRVYLPMLSVSPSFAVDVDILAIESLELFDALRCACVDLSVWCKLQNVRNAAGVVHLNVVADQNVNLCWIDDALNALNQLLGEWTLDGVNGMLSRPR